MHAVEQMATFTGELADPAVTLHTTGDPAGTTADEFAYADVVRWAGDTAQLRQTFVVSDGHCTFTNAEMAAAMQTLLTRIDTGRWPATSAARLGTLAARLEAESGIDLGATRFGQPVAKKPARPWDARDWGSYPGR